MKTRQLLNSGFIDQMDSGRYYELFGTITSTFYFGSVMGIGFCYDIGDEQVVKTNREGNPVLRIKID